MTDVISLASRFVEVPGEHKEIVPRIDETSTKPSGKSVHIRSSKEEPAFPYRIQHRGYCFYVDDRDLNTRVFLEAVVAAYTSRVGLQKSGEGQPDLVIPISGVR